MTAQNMPILYINIMDGLPDDFARDVFLWAVERPGEDRMCYRAEKFAREASDLVKQITGLIDLSNWVKFVNRSGVILDDKTRDDLVSFCMTRHANWRYGGNVRPTYCEATP